MDVFFLSLDGTHIRHVVQNDGSLWHGEDLPIPATDAQGVRFGSVAAASLGPGHIDLLYTRRGGSVHHTWWDGSRWAAEERLDWGTVHGLCSVGWPDADRLDVFYRMENGHLGHRWWYQGSWSGGNDLGGEVAGQPTAASWEGGRLDVFYRSPGGNLIHRWRHTRSPLAGGDFGLENLGGQLSSDPAAISDARNSIHVLYNSGGSMVDRPWIDGRGWTTGEKRLDVPYTQIDSARAPAACSWGPGRVDIFYARKDPENPAFFSVFHKWHN
jgi:hypothetical protein